MTDALRSRPGSRLFHKHVVFVCWHAVGCLGQHTVSHALLVWLWLSCWPALWMIAHWLVRGCCGVGVLCENCIVDASIFLLSMLHCFGGVWVRFLCFANVLCLQDRL